MNPDFSYDFYRGRRLRSSSAMRSLVRETHLSKDSLIMPYFVVDTTDKNLREEIPSMPGQYRLSLQELEKEITPAVTAGLNAVLLFGIPKKKDELASEAYAFDGIVQQACRMLKSKWPNLLVITDVCLCEYTSHGHCGILAENDKIGKVLNDPTLDLLARTAVSHVEAGADIVAPSDMMDGRIAAIRSALDDAGYTDTPIMSYSVKYASAYYGPFRDAADSAPHHGDRRTYQMDPANGMEALRESRADLNEGADILMVKPAGPYQDIIRLVSDNFDAPLCAYQVSGEYSLIKAASKMGWIDEDRMVIEALTGIRRSGASIIITYFAADLIKRGLIK